MSDLRSALSANDDAAINEYLTTAGPEQFRAELIELAQPSITLRHQFAMIALRCLWSDPGWAKPQEQTARTCYQMADAMLKAGEERGG